MEYACSGKVVMDSLVITPAAHSGELTGRSTHDCLVIVCSNYSPLYSSFHLLVNFNLKAAQNNCRLMLGEHVY